MSEQEMIKVASNLKKGEKIKAKLGDYIIGFDIVDMEFEELLEEKKQFRAIHKIPVSRFNPKGRIDNYLLPLGYLVLE